MWKEDKGFIYEIQSYYLHNNYIGLVKCFYIRTTDNTIVDLCLSEFPEAQIKKIYRGRLQ
nr:hypothetical protein [Bacillus mycoides]